MVLTKEQVLDLNISMLGLGAPITKDGEGYNKPDFNAMNIYQCLPADAVNARVLYEMLRRLKNYSNTQLTAYADSINESLEATRAGLIREYGIDPEERDDIRMIYGNITVDRASRESILLSPFTKNAAVSEFIQTHKPNGVRWVKLDNGFQVSTTWGFAESLADAFDKAGFDTKAFREFIEKRRPEEYGSEKTVKVMAAKDGIISVTFPRDPLMTKYIREHRGLCRWDNTPKGWRLLIKLDTAETVSAQFRALGFDTKELDATVSKAHEMADKEPLRLSVMSVSDCAPGNVFIADADPQTKTMLKEMPTYSRRRFGDTLGIDDILPLYRKMQETGRNIAATGLDAWLKQAYEWDRQYTAKEPPQTPYTPYEFQLRDVDGMLEKKRCILGNEMGCGKTHECIRVGYSLPYDKLIICPASLKLNWEKEIKMCDPEADTCIIQSSTKEITRHEWMIIGYPSVSKHLEALLALGIQVVFADEAHYVKAVNNFGMPTSKRAKAVLELCAHAGWVYAVTGTPKTSRNKDTYNLLRMIRHPLVAASGSFYDYGMRYCDGEQTYFGMDFSGNSNDNELYSKLAPYMIRHLKKDVLPDLHKQRQMIPLDMPVTAYEKAMKEARKVMAVLKKEGKKNSAEVLALLQKARHALAEAKLKDTLDFAESIVEAGEQVVIVSCFKVVVDSAMERFKDACCKIDGSMNDKDKQEAINAFQNREKQVIAINIVAGGVGVTLTAANKMIMNDLPWTTGELVQAEDRICRTGQDRDCIIYYMVSDRVPVEKKMIETLTKKSDTINQAIDNGEGESVDFISLIQESQENKK